MSRVRWLPDDDPVQVGVHKDAASGEETLVHQQDVEALVRQTKRIYNDAAKTPRRDRFFYPLARIPNAIAFKWLVEDGVDCNNPAHADKVVALLHRPEWKDLRLAPGNYQRKPDRQFFSGAAGGGIAGATAKLGINRGKLRSGAFGAR